MSELIITGGSSTPLDGDFAYDMDDIQAALAERKTRMDETKKKSASGKTRNAPEKTTKGTVDLGF